MRTSQAADWTASRSLTSSLLGYAHVRSDTIYDTHQHNSQGTRDVPTAGPLDPAAAFDIAAGHGLL